MLRNEIQTVRPIINMNVHIHLYICIKIIQSYNLGTINDLLNALDVCSLNRCTLQELF